MLAAHPALEQELDKQPLKTDGALDQAGITFGLGFTLHSKLTFKDGKVVQSNYHDFVKTPDNEGYFKYHQSQGCFIEIVSYDKVLNDVKKLATFPSISVPTITLEGDANGAPHPPAELTTNPTTSPS